MGKRVYRVKKGDDFFKISRKLYGNASYVMDLLRANPGFYRLGKGMVLRLPKEDPRLTRKRKIKRRMKDYIPPPEETEDTTNQGIPSEGETGYSEDSGAELSQSGESLGWDPAFEDEIINSIAETAKKMGLDADVMADELGMSEGHLPSKEASSKDWTQSRTEKGNLHSPRTSSGQDTQSQTGESSQAATGSTTPPVTLTDEQIDALKDNLEKLGLDVDVAMEELGLGEGAAASTTESQTTDTGVDGEDDGKVARPAEPEGPTQTETPPPPAYQDIQTREEADAWFNDRFYKAKEKGDRAMMRQLELARYAKLYELWLRKKEGYNATSTPTPTATPEPDFFTYTVTEGDTLWGIAADYLGKDSSLEDQNALVKDIEEKNPDAAGGIFIGQEIIIPRPYSGRYQDPIEAYAPIQGSGFQVLQSRYGTDIGDGRIHTGVDIKAEDPTIRANVEGEVYFFQATSYGITPYDPNTKKEDLRDFGNYVVLVSELEGKNYYQVFAHLDNFSGDITQGQSVDAGTVLGTMGSTGASDYPHVHWEIRTSENVVIETDQDGNTTGMKFNNLPNGYYVSNQEQLNQYTVDPYEFVNLLFGQNE